jgi:hypothetical protein
LVSAPELQKLFRLSLTNVLKTRSVWLFIDALDECEEDQADNLVKELQSLLMTLPPTESQFQICFTSRHYPIRNVAYAFELCLEDENQKDIVTYVKAQLSVLEGVECSTIMNILTSRTAGVFMWVRLVPHNLSLLHSHLLHWDSPSTNMLNPICWK